MARALARLAVVVLVIAGSVTPALARFSLARLWGRKSPLDTVLDRQSSMRELDAVLETVQRAHAAGQRPVVVFDIDDTLIKWRKVNGVKTTSKSPMPGGADYVHALARAGARIVYLTARPESMKAETVDVLRAARLPLDARHELIMSPFEDRPAVDGKRVAQPKILAKGRPIAFFDNDFANVRLFRQQYPGATVVRLAGHSANKDPERRRGLDGVRVVRNFAAFSGYRLPDGKIRRASIAMAKLKAAGQRKMMARPFQAKRMKLGTRAKSRRLR